MKYNFSLSPPALACASGRDNRLRSLSQRGTGFAPFGNLLSRVNLEIALDGMG
jgi:hypothetical protein